jgi:hypothetical protein
MWAPANAGPQANGYIIDTNTRRGTMAEISHNDERNRNPFAVDPDIMRQDARYEYETRVREAIDRERAAQ